MTSWNISASLPVSYSIKSIPGLWDTSNVELSSYCPARRALLAIDTKVSQLYLPVIERYFQHHQIAYRIVLIDGVETSKNMDNLLLLLTEMEQFGIPRNSVPVIAIGGGVIADLVGTAATLYRRGVPFIRVPTTLLGIVDVSVAIKNGINFLERRNRLGSYYYPVVSLFDKAWLQTLPSNEVSSGMGEILKMGIIKDAHLFGLLERHGAELLSNKFQHPVAEEVIGLAIEGMRVELQDNLLEKNLKRIVDFGHSFSPIIEMRSLTDLTVPSLLHGEAVTLDGIFSCLICLNRGMLSPLEVDRVIQTAKKCGLPTYHPSFAEPTLLWEALTDTSKHREAQNLPAPTTIGTATFINDLTYQEVVSAVKIFKELE